MNKVIIKEIDLNGRKLKLETGKLALQQLFWQQWQLNL